MQGHTTLKLFHKWFHQDLAYPLYHSSCMVCLAVDPKPQPPKPLKKAATRHAYCQYP